MTGYELESAIREVQNSLNGIVAETEKFASENILGGGFFGNNCGWNDVCGNRIAEALVSSVKQTVEGNLNLYGCKAELDKIYGEACSVISVISAAEEELR